MTPHPCTVAAARAIWQTWDDEPPVHESQLAAVIERECHVSEMVEALRALMRYEGVLVGHFLSERPISREIRRDFEAAAVLLKKVQP